MGRVGNTVMYIINIEFKSCFDFVVRTSFYGMQIATSHLIVCFRVANQIKTDFFFFLQNFREIIVSNPKSHCMLFSRNSIYRFSTHTVLSHLFTKIP